MDKAPAGAESVQSRGRGFVPVAHYSLYPPPFADDGSVPFTGLCSCSTVLERRDRRSGRGEGETQRGV